MEVLRKKLTYHEFRELEFDDNDNFWYELINGELVRKQAPSIRHQRISGEIVFALKNFERETQSGMLLYAPSDVVLDDGNAYHPDIFFIKKERYFILDEKEQIVSGAPDLVIEILSKSTAVYDRGEKKDIYEKYGVREYWIVDPEKKSIEVYSLKDERFRLTIYLEDSGILESPGLEGFEMDIAKVFSGATPVKED